MLFGLFRHQPNSFKDTGEATNLVYIAQHPRAPFGGGFDEYARLLLCYFQAFEM